MYIGSKITRSPLAKRSFTRYIPDEFTHIPSQEFLNILFTKKLVMSSVLDLILHYILFSYFFIEATLKAGLPVKISWYYE